jgi:N-dimethylarginine dimethylaminohydrolase
LCASTRRPGIAARNDDSVPINPESCWLAAMTNAPARFLMCPPDHYAVAYSINPWMDPATWSQNDRALAKAARREWVALRRTLSELGATIELVPAAAGLPDLVFTANSAVVLDGKALMARFRHRERQGEGPHYETALRALQGRGHIMSVVALPDGLVLEGAGDCVWDVARNLFWMGYGPRSDLAAREAVADTFGVEVVALELADPRFYHVDTALSALPGGELMYVPGAFTAAGRAAIAERTSPGERIAIADANAGRLAANTVCVGDALVMPGCGEDLWRVLEARGYRVMVVPLPAFLRSGGAAFCLTLRLDRRSAARAADARAAVA